MVEEEYNYEILKLVRFELPCSSQWRALSTSMACFTDRVALSLLLKIFFFGSTKKKANGGISN